MKKRFFFFFFLIHFLKLVTTTTLCDEVYCSPGQYCKQDETCTSCTRGYYCDGYSRLKCPKGSYCPAQGMEEPLDCPEGYFCKDLRIQTPSKCGLGNFCPTKSITPTPCSIGYFCPGETSFEGTICPETNYCDQTGLTLPAGICDDGCLCPIGSTNSCPLECPIGSKCQNGVSQACEAGKFVNVTRSSSCDFFCAPGYYCSGNAINEFGHTLQDSTTKFCKEGHYCEEGSIDEFGNGECDDGFYCPKGSYKKDQEHCPLGYSCVAGLKNKCPAGYYNDELDQTVCIKQCDAGYFCPGEALSTTSHGSGKCSEGFYCPPGSSSPQQTSCPIGHYCTEGLKYECPEGYYNDQIEQTSCPTLCEEGYYCESGSATEFGSGNCEEGYYCPKGSSSPTEEDCPIGFYCTSGVKYPCAAGYYQNETNSQTCKLCEDGYFCPEGSVDSKGIGKCEDGYYLELGESTKHMCPKGFHCKNGKKTICPSGVYNNLILQSECTKECNEGYYCEEGSISRKGRKYTDADDTEYPCDEGYYCLSGSIDSKGRRKNDKNPKTCEDGYHCSKGSGNSKNEICPVGHFCMSGRKWKCAAGFYNDKLGQINCTKCSAGFYCEEGATSSTGSGFCLDGFYCDEGANTPTQHICPAGKYCKFGQSYSCPEGTFNSYIGKTEICSTLCAGGYYCPRGSIDEKGRLNETDSPSFCQEGYYCLEGSKTAKGNGQCNDGSYCPQGSSSPSQEMCSEGFYCIAGIPIICPERFYCTQNSSEPIACQTNEECPEGTAFPILIDDSDGNREIEIIATSMIASISFIVIFLCCFGIIFSTILLIVKKRRLNKIAPYLPQMTFIFTDIENSTKLWSRHKIKMTEYLEIHDKILRRLLKKYKGFEVKQIGDSLFCCFEDPVNALKWMKSIQIELMKAEWDENLLSDENCCPHYFCCDADTSAPNTKHSCVPMSSYSQQPNLYEANQIVNDTNGENPSQMTQNRSRKGKLIFKGLRVRCACHFGGSFKRVYNKQKDIWDYLGNDINFAARLEKYSNGGQIVVSQSYLEAVSSFLEQHQNEWFCRKVQDVELKGVDGQHSVYEIIHQSLVERMIYMSGSTNDSIKKQEIQSIFQEDSSQPKIQKKKIANNSEITEAAEKKEKRKTLQRKPSSLELLPMSIERSLESISLNSRNKRKKIDRIKFLRIGNICFDDFQEVNLSFLGEEEQDFVAAPITPSRPMEKWN